MLVDFTAITNSTIASWIDVIATGKNKTIYQREKRFVYMGVARKCQQQGSAASLDNGVSIALGKTHHLFGGVLRRNDADDRQVRNLTSTSIRYRHDVPFLQASTNKPAAFYC